MATWSDADRATPGRAWRRFENYRTESLRPCSLQGFISPAGQPGRRRARAVAIRGRDPGLVAPGKILDGLGGLTRHEFDLWARQPNTYCSDGRTRDTIVPRNAPLATEESAIVSSRPFMTIRPYSRSVRAPVIRSRSFLLAGRSYCSTDVTQAFSLWQSKFLGASNSLVAMVRHADDRHPADAIVGLISCSGQMSENAMSQQIVRVERTLTDTHLFAEGFGASYLRQHTRPSKSSCGVLMEVH